MIGTESDYGASRMIAYALTIDRLSFKQSGRNIFINQKEKTDV
jgi:hypothetical protein